MVMRSKIILMADRDLHNQSIADDLGIHIQTPRRWRNRWSEGATRLKDLEADLDDKALLPHIEDLLSDEPRSGRPATFEPEQICQIVALACESPETSDRPVTHWTHAELADEVIKRNIVESISSRSVGRFLKGRDAETASQPLLVEQ